jgi:hypothetical protein
VQATGVKDAALIPLAAEYLRVRALGQPAVLATMVAQGGECQSCPITIFVDMVLFLTGTQHLDCVHENAKYSDAAYVVVY